MNHTALSILMNDHLAGSSAAIPLAQHCRDRNAGRPLAAVLDDVITGIEEDRAVLEQLIAAVGHGENPVKKAAGWLFEKFARARMASAAVEDPDLATLLELQGLMIGIEGKRLLWVALEMIKDQHPALAAVNFVTLQHRATDQHDRLEAQHNLLAPVVFKRK